MRNSRSRKLESFSIGRLGVNLNGDLSEKELITRLSVVDGKVKAIWIGEFEGFEDPFSVAETVCRESRLIVGFGVLSAQKGCERIMLGVEELRDKYGDRFIIGIGAGNFSNAREAYKNLKKCLEKLESVEYPVVVGSTSPMTAKLSQRVDGVLFNSVNEKFISWLSGYAGNNFRAAYGPALITPSQNEEDLLIAAAIVFLGAKKLQEKFGFQRIAEELSRVNLRELILHRQSGGSIADCRGSEVLLKYRDFLLENFTISGSFENVRERVRSLLRFCDHVVLADPFFRDLEALRMVGELF